MRRLGLALFFALLGLAPAQSQPVTNPANGVAAAYNSVAPTCTSGIFCWLQVDVNGNLKFVGSITSLTASAVTVTTPSVPTPGTFVVVLAANTSRKACTITNIGTTQGYCNAIAQASATTSNTMPVNASGGQFICASTSGPPASTAISCTCASGTCSFVVNEQ